ncbi:mucin-6 [Gallus gallus]|uniref:mucin-6 n=1 Tax=Gallus gallus TaxID=9031 RepID=UPI001AE2537E|nr:mucin-6 [Gallus gallus]
MGKTCGMCGNYDGYELNDFVSEGKLLDTYKFAALQKMDDPSEICLSEEISIPAIPHKKYAVICSQLLNLVSPTCSVPKDGFVTRCQLDMQDCSEPGQKNCTCSTLSEYSRQCAMSHQVVFNWRTENFCSVGKCSANQIYEECGSPCIKTCSNPEYSCSSHCTYGCFCPEGTVLDDISKNRTCVHLEQCPCTLNGETYAPGDTMKAACRTCKCTMGQWNCKELPCPGRCSLEGGSFVTTFDSRSYRFHGVCTYILMKSSSLPHNGTLMAIYEKSGYSHSETSLSAIIYLSTKDKIVISQNELLTDDDELKRLPYKSGDITIFKQSSMFIQMHTEFGLELVVQTSPVFQAYVKVSAQFQGRTLGLCGNYNGDTTDDFMTSMDITEGTASLFVDSWRAGNCLPAMERETDPCALSQLNKISAETHCSILTKKGTVFETCHAVVNPTPFYKRCVYQACNYEETFPYICSALGSYARTCSSMGLILENWRNSMDNCTITCTGNQTFSYNTQACERTCLSLSNPTLECHPTDIPIEGCNCPKGMYLNHKNECVRKSHCPCYLEDRKYILPDQSTMTGGITCYCVNGRLSCTGKLQNPAESCKAPKKYISCSDSLENKYGATCAPTCQMLATGIECIPTKCESGCVCADGLYENLDGRCVPPEECPCEYGGLSYGKGEQIQTECEICTCRKGKWKCVQKSRCSSTCNLYGEGHITTFDGQRFVFDGNCEYILAMDGCNVNRPLSSFKIVTENVICGKSGVTCSRSISIYLGNLTIILRDETYSISGKNLQVKYNVKKNALHLMFDIIIPGKYNMTLIWNKHMNFFIKISRETQETICGLCGNYNGNMKDDFETRSKYVASNELEFVNSWKENPLCGDVYFVVDPCSKNPYRKAWAEKTCSIINSQVFSACHNKVNRMPYYEACVRDSCGCDIGGDCECMCDAIAVYAMACLDKGICIDWRTPEFCPVYCEYYNSHRKTGSGGAYSYGSSVNCTWHYRPCNCPNQYYKYVNIEGCYNCSHDEYFDYEKEKCMPCGDESISTTPETSSPSTVTAMQPKETRVSTSVTLPTATQPTSPSTSSASTVLTETTNPPVTSKITVSRTSSSSPLVTIKSTTEHTTSIFTMPSMTTTVTAPSITTSAKRTIFTEPKSTPTASATTASVETEKISFTTPLLETTVKKEMTTISIPYTTSQIATFSKPELTTVAVTHKRPTTPHAVPHLITQKTTPVTLASSISKTSVSTEASSPEVALTRLSLTPSSLPATSAVSVSSPSSPFSTRLRPSHPASKTTVPPLTTEKTTPITSFTSTSKTSVSSEASPTSSPEIPLTTTFPAPSSTLSTRLLTPAPSPLFSTLPPISMPKTVPTTLRPKPYSPTTSASTESLIPASSTPSTAKTSLLPSSASSPYSTVSSTVLSTSHPATSTHKKTTVLHVVPYIITEKTTPTMSTTSTSKTSISSKATSTSSPEVPLTTTSPALSSTLSTRLSSPVPSTLFSTSPSTSTPKPTSTTLRLKPSSLTTSAPAESPTTAFVIPSTAKTSLLPSVSSPLSTVSSTAMKTSQPTFTHKMTTVPHIVPSVTTEKTTPTVSATSTSKTSISSEASPTSSPEIPLTTTSSAPSSTLSTSLPSTAPSTLFSTLLPTSTPKSTPTTLRPKLSPLTTSAPTESPTPASSTLSTAKTSLLPSSASSPFSTISSTVWTTSLPAFTHETTTVLHVEPYIITERTTATPVTTSTSMTSISSEASPTSSPEVPLTTTLTAPSSAPSTRLSSAAPSTVTSSPPTSIMKSTPTTLRPKPSSPVTSVQTEFFTPASSTLSTVKTSPLLSLTSSTFSTMSSTAMRTSQPTFTHKMTTVPHIVPSVTTEKTTPTASATSTSKTSISSEASPTSSPEIPLTTTSSAPSSTLSTSLPSAAPSTLSSTTKLRPTTLRPKPSSMSTSAPTESPTPASSTPSTAKTSLLSLSPSSFSTVSSTAMSTSYPTTTHKMTTLLHMVPYITTEKTTPTTSSVSTSKTSISSEASPTSSPEIPLTTTSSAPSSTLSTRLQTPAPSTLLSTLPSPSTPKPTPTTLRLKPSSLTTSAPTESPTPASSTLSTAKTSLLPSSASSPFSTISSTVRTTSLPASTHKMTTVPHIVPSVTTEKTTPTVSATSTSKTSISSEASPTSSPEVPLTTTSSAPSSTLSTSLPSTAPSTLFSTLLPTSTPKSTPTTLRPKLSPLTTSAPTESPTPASSTLSTAKTSLLPSSASSPFSTISSTVRTTSLPATSTHKKTTVLHVVPYIFTEKTTVMPATTSISKTSISSEASPTSSPEVPLTTTFPAPSSALSTRLPSAASSTLFSTSPPTSTPEPTLTTLSPSTFLSSESATYSSSTHNTTFSFTPPGETFSVAFPTAASAKSSPVVIPSLLPTTIKFAPSITTTASTEIPSIEQTSIQTTTLTTTHTTSSLSVTSGLSTSLSPVRPSTVPQEFCKKVEYEENITYKGCSANVTLSRCEGLCPSSTKLNVENMVFSAACSCCRPLQLHKEKFQLPCEDPDNPGKRLTKEITVFGGCVCNFDSCIQ